MGSEIYSLGIQIEIWALFISFIAIIFTLLKDFILPWWFKPRLEFNYEEKPPYRRENVVINRQNNLRGTFLRFSIKNTGRAPALNCRCQITKLERGGKLYGDYQGFPLKWASRPECVINQASGERLNIGIGETEFVDLVVAANTDSNIHFQKYHQIDIGIKEFVEAGSYQLFLLFSGDNFKPYTLQFYTNKKDSNDISKIKMNLVNVTQ